MTVTADGAAYYERARALLAELRDVEDTLSQQAAAPHGRIRIDAPTLIARSVIIPALPAFFALYPDIDLALSCNERQFDLIADGIDCALRIGEVTDASLVARRVGYLYFATCAAPVYLAAHGMPLHPRELAAHRCINRFAPRSEDTFQWVFSKGSERIAAVFPSHLALEDENSYVTAAEAGLGIAQLPAFVLKDAMERRTLELLLPQWLAEPAPLHIVYPHNRHLQRKVRVFVDWLAQLLSEHDGIQLRSTLPAPHSGPPSVNRAPHDPDLHATPRR